MKPEIKALWVAALRSGEYNQTEGKLRSGGGFCCLGVLCDLHSKTGMGTWNIGSYSNSSDILPEDVGIWAEVENCPTVNDIPLVDLNDGVNGFEQRTFAQIADLIEEFL